MMARRLSDSCRKISGWRSTGKKFMMRSIAWLALFECSVARHRWPVSAKVIAASMVSRSRTSPMRMTSGAWRSVFFSACSKDVGVEADLALGDDALLVRVDELDRILDGDDVAGGGLVAVVDHGRQGGRLARAGGAGDQHQAALGERRSSLSIGGRPSSSMVGIVVLIWRMTTPTAPR